MRGQVAGINTGLNMTQQRADREQKLQQQQETHQSNMANQSQKRDINDLKIEQIQTQMDQTNKSIFMRDTDAALDSWAEHGDATLFKAMKDNPQFKKLFGDISDIKTVNELNTFDGMEDQLLIENGIPEADIAKMSPEDKQKILHANGEHLVVMTAADGSKITTSLEELSAGTGRLSRADKTRRDMYVKAIHAGGAKRGLALAELNDDKEATQGFKDTLAELSKYGSSTSKQQREPSKVQEAKFLYPNDTAKQQEYVKDKVQTAGTRALEEQANILDNAKELAKEVEVGTMSVTSRAVVPAYNLESKYIKDDKTMLAITKDFSGTLDALTSFSGIADTVAKSGMTKNVLTTMNDKVNAMNNKDIAKVSKLWRNHDDAQSYISEADEYVNNKGFNRRLVDKELQIATMALIKSMSGLAVSDGERKTYMDLAGAGNMASMQEVLTSAMAYISSKKQVLGKQLDRVSNIAPIHAAVYKKQLSEALVFTGEPNKKISKQERKKVQQERAARAAKVTQDIFKSMYEAGK